MVARSETSEPVAAFARADEHRWYGERARPGVFRDIRPAWSDDNLLSIAHQIRSRLLLAHVRASTGTASTRANCHPFAVGEWLFMHNGQIGGYAHIRRRLEQEVPARYERQMNALFGPRSNLGE